MIRGWQRPDEPDPVRLDDGVVVAAVLPGVIDHGQRLDPAHQVAVAGHQLVDDRDELGDVGPVAGIGVADHRHPAVAGDHQRQPDQPQVGAFLFGLAALRDRRALVAGVDEGGEVGHVQHQPGQVQPELGDHPPSQPGLDRAQLALAEAVHRVPEPAVIQRGAAQLHPSRPGRGLPTSRRIRAWSTGRRSGSRTPTRGRCPPTRPRPRGGAPPRRRSRPRPAGSASTTPPPGLRTACAGYGSADRSASATAWPSPRRRCPDTAGTRCAACRPPAPTPPGSSRSARRGASPRSTPYMGNTLQSHKPQAPQRKTRRSITKAGNSR